MFFFFSKLTQTKGKLQKIINTFVIYFTIIKYEIFML